jgi:hypothetical protein
MISLLRTCKHRRVRLGAVDEDLEFGNVGKQPYQVGATIVEASTNLRVGNVMSPLRDSSSNALDVQIG